MHLLVYLQNVIVQQLCFISFRKLGDTKKLVRIGTNYGGWWIPESFLIHSERKCVVISAGIGHDVSFDEGLLKAGFHCIAMDPLKECIEFARDKLAKYPNLILENIGISSHTGIEKFFPPANSSHDSWSLSNIQNVIYDSGKDFAVISLSDLLVKHKELIDSAVLVLKMDIEGAEKFVIPTICDLDFTLDYLAIEMDFLSLIPFVQMRRRVSEIFFTRSLLLCLQKKGYKLVKTENFNFFWIKDNER